MEFLGGNDNNIWVVISSRVFQASDENKDRPYEGSGVNVRLSSQGGV